MPNGGRAADAPPCASPFLSDTHVPELPRLARKPNYDYEKRRKEMERQAKKDAKKEERARRKAAGLPDDVDEYGNPRSSDDSEGEAEPEPV